MIEIAALSALGALGSVVLSPAKSSLFKAGILCVVFGLLGVRLSLQAREAKPIYLVRDRYSIYLVPAWLSLGFTWVSFGFRLGFLQTHSGRLFRRLGSVAFGSSALFSVGVI